MSETKKDYGELQKYYDMLLMGNAIAARFDKGFISKQDAKDLFGEMIEKLAREIQREKLKQ